MDFLVCSLFPLRTAIIPQILSLCSFTLRQVSRLAVSILIGPLLCLILKSQSASAKAISSFSPSQQSPYEHYFLFLGKTKALVELKRTKQVFYKLELENSSLGVDLSLFQGITLSSNINSFTCKKRKQWFMASHRSTNLFIGGFTARLYLHVSDL